MSRTLFAAARALKRDRESAALEYRIAAWLYLEYRVQAASLPPGDELRKLYRELGQSTAATLYESDAEADLRLAKDIRSRVNREKS